MTDEEKEVYERTVKRLRRCGVTDPTAQIIFLAEEIEYYRSKIRGLEEHIAASPPLLQDTTDSQTLMEAAIEHLRRIGQPEVKLEAIDLGAYMELMNDTRPAGEVLNLIKPAEQTKEE